ncbi:MAG: hypothetical protein U0R18_00410 [Mycobacterium sp.]
MTRTAYRCAGVSAPTSTLDFTACLADCREANSDRKIHVAGAQAR